MERAEKAKNTKAHSPAKNEECPDYMDYPFGFGFALMENGAALERFRKLDDTHKAEIMRRVLRSKSHVEVRKIVDELGK